MTTISAVMRRSYSPGMFVDLTDVSHVRTFDKATGVTTLTFDSPLDEPTADAIWARMESKDDVDQERRSALRSAAAGLASDDPIRLAICYVLGD